MNHVVVTWAHMVGDVGTDVGTDVVKLANALDDSLTTQCSLCKIVNPHHKDCTSCPEVDSIRDLIKSVDKTN